MTSQAYLRWRVGVVVAVLDGGDGDAERVVDRFHPFGVAAGQVVVDGDDVDAVAGQRVEEDRQGRGQGLALAGPHLGDRAVVEDHAADQLHVVVALAGRAPRGLAGQREGLRQQVVERLAVAGALAQRVGLLAQLVVGEGFHLRLEAVDRLGALLVGLEFPPLPRAQGLRYEVHCWHRLKSSGARGVGRSAPTNVQDRVSPCRLRVAGVASKLGTQKEALMRMEIRGRNVEITDDLREMVRKRFQRLGRQVSDARHPRRGPLRRAQPLDRRQPGGRGDLPSQGRDPASARVLAGDDPQRARAGRGPAAAGEEAPGTAAQAAADAAPGRPDARPARRARTRRRASAGSEAARAKVTRDDPRRARPRAGPWRRR